MRRTKPHPKKDKALVEIKDRLGRAKATIITDYRGLTVAQLTQLRIQLEQHDVEYVVAKNTLVRIAGQQGGYPDMTEVLKGPTAVAFAYGNEIASAKTLVDFATSSKILKIRGGLLGRRLMAAQDVASLASSPPISQLFAQVLGTLQSPAASALGVLTAPSRSLLYLLQRRAEQLETQGA